MTDLPPGWEWTTLGDIAETTLGKMLDRKKDTGNHPVPYLRNINVQWGRIDLDDVLTMDIPPEEQGYFGLRPGDLLVCEGGEVGRCAVWPGSNSYMAFQKALHRIRPLGGVSASYLRYVLENLSIHGGLLPYATGSTIKHIPQQQLRRLPIPLPSLAEQQRIIAVLEEHFSRLDAATELVENGKARAAVLRRKILDDADSQLADTPRKRLVELLREPLRNGHSARATQSGLGIRTLTLTAVTNNEFTEKNTKVAAADPDRVRHLWLHPGDIFVQRSNTPDLVGSSAIYSGPEGWAIFPDLLIRVRVSSLLLPEFAYLMLSTSRVRSCLRSSAKGLAGSMPKIDQGAIERIEIPIPSLDAQHEFVEYVKTQQEGVSRLLDGLKSAQSQSGRLRRSLLREAFSGRLLPQDPADEPASELLARIEAERAAQSKPNRTRRTTPKEPPTATHTEWPEADRTPVTYEQEELL